MIMYYDSIALAEEKQALVRWQNLPRPTNACNRSEKLLSFDSVRHKDVVGGKKAIRACKKLLNRWTFVLFWYSIKNKGEVDENKVKFHTKYGFSKHIKG